MVDVLYVRHGSLEGRLPTEISHIAINPDDYALRYLNAHRDSIVARHVEGDPGGESALMEAVKEHRTRYPTSEGVWVAFRDHDWNITCELVLSRPGDVAQLEQSKIQVGTITYSVTLIPSDGKFVTAWRCPICKRRQGCSYYVESHAEAAKCAEEEVLKHHSQHHGDDSGRTQL